MHFFNAHGLAAEDLAEIDFFLPRKMRSCVVLQNHPEIAHAFADLGGKISAAEMQRMNYAVDGEHRDARDVVREFLQTVKLVP